MDYTLLIMPGAFASSVALSVDILSSAALLAKSAGCTAPRWRVCSTLESVPLSNGMQISARHLPQKTDHSTWIIPGMGLANARAIAQRMQQADAQSAIHALQRHAQRGGVIAASCSSVFLLQAAGLLAGKRVTTSWWFASLLQQMETGCVVDVNRILICDGNLITAGAALAQADLMLYLLRSQFSPALADAVARSLLIDGKQSQAQFIAPSMLAHGSELLSKLVTRFEQALPNPPSVAELAAECCMSERTLARHVRAASGCSTNTLLQNVRLNKARMLLASGDMSVEQVAAAVGYLDSSALRRLLRKTTGATPSQFRAAGMR
ncbi:MAG: helix-turn-helix domain-containing protein [Burkholderiales bacterium]|nr:helix-turn-helix domain-containing protein [Burkholderiales bacterium]